MSAPIIMVVMEGPRRLSFTVWPPVRRVRFSRTAPSTWSISYRRPSSSRKRANSRLLSLSLIHI